MFRKMRRFAQSLSEEENIEILSRNTSGVLALSGDEGYPYALPMAYCYDNGRIIFHSASKGHKIDAVGNCDKASFCVIDRDDVFPEEYTTKYRSVIVFGKIRILEDKTEAVESAVLFAEKYRPGNIEEARKRNERSLPGMAVLELKIEHMTGKKALR